MLKPVKVGFKVKKDSVKMAEGLIKGCVMGYDEWTLIQLFSTEMHFCGAIRAVRPVSGVPSYWFL